MEILLMLHPVGKLPGTVAESLKEHFAKVGWGQYPGALGMDHSLPDADGSDLIHWFRY
jgi:hypothetical protein